MGEVNAVHGVSRALVELWDQTGHDRAALLDAVESIAGGGTWLWDVASDRVVWSLGLYRLLGRDPATEVATADGFFAALHPEDVERVRAQSRLSVETGVTPWVDCRVVRPNGEVRHVRLDGLAVKDARGVLIRLIGTAVDTTESRARESALARSAALLGEAQRIAGFGSWYWEPSTGRIEWSDEMYRIFGVTRDVVPTEELFFSRVHPRDVALARAARAPSVAAPHGPTELRIVRPDGTERSVIIESRLYGDPREPVPAVVGVVLDVTERNELEEGLRAAQRMEALGQLSGGIAHDFNNLLAVIQSTAEALKKRGIPELDIVLQATERGAALTRQLLAFSRRDVVRVTTVPLREAVLGATHLLRRVLGENVEMVIDLAPDL